MLKVEIHETNIQFNKKKIKKHNSPNNIILKNKIKVKELNKKKDWVFKGLNNNKKNKKNHKIQNTIPINNILYMC